MAFPMLRFVSHFFGCAWANLLSAFSIRHKITMLMEEGDALKQECTSLEERPWLSGKADAWNTKTQAYLESVETSYAALFRNPRTLSCTTSINNKPIPTINQRVLIYVSAKVAVLGQILQSIPD